ncbi:uncharacterized protein V6R79_000315 [Siganus canaliculatus]
MTEKSPKMEHQSPVAGHKRSEMPLGTVFDPSWVPNTEASEGELLRRTECAGTEENLVSQLPHEASGCNNYTANC